MITRYATVATLTAAAFSLMALSPASALEGAQAQPAEGKANAQGADVPISEKKLEAFAVAYLEVDKVRQKYAAKIGASSDAAATQKLKTEAGQQMLEAVKSSADISVEEYTAILTAAQKDPALAKKVQEKLQGSAAPQQ